MEKVDETIECVCDWIETEIKKGSAKPSEITSMIKALSELISARALNKTFNHQGN